MRMMMSKIRNWLSRSREATMSPQPLEHPVGAIET